MDAKARKRLRKLREYGPPGRVKWVKDLPCVVPGCDWHPCDNHHTSAGGMGMKGPYQSIVPLCSGPHGHHQLFHTIGVLTFEKLTGLDLKEEAAEIERRWLEHEEGMI